MSIFDSIKRDASYNKIVKAKETSQNKLARSQAFLEACQQEDILMDRRRNRKARSLANAGMQNSEQFNVKPKRIY